MESKDSGEYKSRQAWNLKRLAPWVLTCITTFLALLLASSIKVSYTVTSPQTIRSITSHSPNCLIFKPGVQMLSCRPEVVSTGLLAIDGAFPYELYHHGEYIFPQTTAEKPGSLISLYINRGLTNNYFTGVDPKANRFRSTVGIPGTIEEARIEGFQFGIAFTELVPDYSGFMEGVFGGLGEQFNRYARPFNFGSSKN